MKIALIYTGYLRSWEICRGWHKEHIWTPETDLFFYTYEKPVFGDTDRECFDFGSLCWHIAIPQPFYPDPFAEHKYSSRRVPENTVYQTLNQWHNNFIGFCLAPLGYDIYVRIRPDIKLNGRMDFKQYDCTGNNIYIPQGLDYGGVNDQFAFGSYEVMKKYYSVYINCHELWRDDGITWHSEGMQLANLNKQGVNIVRFGFPQNEIVR